MKQELAIANLYISNLLHVPSASFLQSEFDPYVFFLEHSFFSSQVPVNSKTFSQILFEENNRAIFHFTDAFQIRWCFIHTDGWLTIIGPYRIDNLSRQESHALASRYQIAPERLHDFQVYYTSISQSTEPAINSAAYTLFTHIYNDTHNIQSFSVSSASETLNIEPSYFMSPATFAEKTHDLEEDYMDAISKGNTAKAIFVLQQIVSRTSFRPNDSNKLLLSKMGSAISRTEGRLALKQMGVPSPILDTISGEYSQLTNAATSEEEIIRIQMELTERYCEIARQYRLSPYSISIRKAIHYIYSHLPDSFSTADIAKEAGLSPNRLSTNFHTETGITLSSYIRNARLERAAQLLLNTTWSIQQICSSIGVPDSNYFSKIFRKKYGSTPSEYRTGLLPK